MSIRILVVFTGGTIGSRSGPDAIGVVSGQTRLLLTRYAAHRDAPIEFDVIEPLNILSENAKPEDWNTLAGAVREVDLTPYAGVIITHGTDTLAYTAAAMSFALSDLDLPIVLVASNHPLDHPEANGLQNFADAVEVIVNFPARGVFVTYANPDGRRLVHRGSRLMSATQFDHYFLSVADSELAEFHDDDLVLRTAAIGDNAGKPPAPRVLDTKFSTSVLYLQAYPGLDYSRLNITGLRAVVHDLYHSGTACVAPGADELSLVGFAARCREESVPLFIVPWPNGTRLYESSQALTDESVQPVSLLTAQTAYVKVMFGLGAGLTNDELRSFVTEEQVADEFIE